MSGGGQRDEGGKVVCLQDDKVLRVRLLDRGGDRLVVVFNARNGGLAGPAARDEFRRTLQGDPRNVVLFVTDPCRAWFARPPLLQRLRGIVLRQAERIGAVSIRTLGSSMGGYGAIALAGVLPVDSAIAFAPRFSPDDSILPDPRVVAERRALAPFDPPTVGSGLEACPWSLVIHGVHGPDHIHAERFPDRASLDHYRLPRAGHNVAACLREEGILAPLIAAALDGDRRGANALLRSAGATLRGRSCNGAGSLPLRHRHPTRSARPSGSRGSGIPQRAERRMP